LNDFPDTFERSKVTKNRRVSDLLRRTHVDTLRCKNKGLHRFVIVIIDLAGEFLHPSHAHPHEQTPPAQIKDRGFVGTLKLDPSSRVTWTHLGWFVPPNPTDFEPGFQDKMNRKDFDDKFN